MKNKFLIVVDTQMDFLHPEGKLYVKDAQHLIYNIPHFIKDNQYKYDGILFTYDTHYSHSYNDSEEAKLFPPHCIAGTWGWSNCSIDMIPHLNVPIFTLYKGVFDMWNEPYLKVNGFLHRDTFFQAIDASVGFDVIGVASDYCVKYAIEGLLTHGKKVTVLRNYTKGIVQEIDKVVEANWPGQVLIQ